MVSFCKVVYIKPRNGLSFKRLQATEIYRQTMGLGKFGIHKHGLSINKFAKDLHDHAITKHVLHPDKIPKSLLILTLSGGGKLDLNRKTYLIENLGSVSKYTNKFYTGEIIGFAMTKNVNLSINGNYVHVPKGIVLKTGDVIECTKLHVTPSVPEGFVVELLIEVA